ncbi:MAG TPA: alpha/beta fold hydrolase [Ilumatobacteraceae bacterium]
MSSELGDRLPDLAVDPSSPSPRARQPWLAGVAAVNALAAWGGAVALATAGTDFGERTNDRLPFDSLVLAGLALATMVAIPLTVLAWSAWTGAARTDGVALVVGLMLMGWIVVQAVILRAFSLFQPAYLGIGAYFVAASKKVRLGPRRRGIFLVCVGAVLVAAGIGLLPHLIKNGLTIMSAVSVVLLLSGLASLVQGARLALRDRRRLSKLVGGVAVVLFVAVAVSIIAPAVAATRVPASDVSSTPASLGLSYQSLTLTTTDGVKLAAWYVQGKNGAGIVVMHGAGSTRSDVLGQSAVLARNGYTVVLIDARGHGDSQGTAMDFGWYGDLDIAAGTEFLASSADIDPGRIGVVGFSMGGEEAIGAAATDPRIHAVVAEGATGRQAGDKEWFSAAYGLRGWIQERLEYVQYGVTDFLTDASPPISLRSAVANAPNTRFLLITAGNVADEGGAASYIQSGASGRVTVWKVDGAGHTLGYDTRPAEWQQHVVEFLHESLS